jgi:hypothetical protein
VYFNNPGFTHIDLEEVSDETGEIFWYKIKEATFRYFNLMQYMLFKGKIWNSIPLMSNLGVDLNSPNSIRSMYQNMMNNPHYYAKFESYCFGLDWFSSHFYRIVQFFYFLNTDM